jgi:hypothetical protein
MSLREAFMVSSLAFSTMMKGVPLDRHRHLRPMSSSLLCPLLMSEIGPVTG